MTQADVLFYSFIAVFLATATITLGGLTGGFTVSDKYLRFLVPALLLQVAAAVVLQFRKLDIAELSLSLKSQIMEVEIPIKKPGSTLTATEKLRSLIDVYRQNSATMEKLADAQAKLSSMQTRLDSTNAYNNKLATVFRDFNAVSSIPSAVDEMFANDNYRPMLDPSLARHHFYDVTLTNFVETALRPLLPDNTVAEALRQLRNERKGPFTPVACDAYVTVPIPATVKPYQAVVRRGSQFDGAQIHLVNPATGNDVWVRGYNLHEHDLIKDSEGKTGELIQLNPETANELFDVRKFQGPPRLVEATAQ